MREMINKHLLDELKFALECLTGETDSWQRYWYDEEPYSSIARTIQEAEGVKPEMPVLEPVTDSTHDDESEWKL